MVSSDLFSLQLLALSGKIWFRSGSVWLAGCFKSKIPLDLQSQIPLFESGVLPQIKLLFCFKNWFVITKILFMWNVNYCVALTGQRSSIICAYNAVEKMEAEQKSNVYNSTTSVHQLIGMCQQKALFAKKKKIKFMHLPKNAEFESSGILLIDKLGTFFSDLCWWLSVSGDKNLMVFCDNSRIKQWIIRTILFRGV